MSLNRGVFALRRAGAVVITALIACAAFSWGNEIRVPQQCPTIQAAVDAAGPGDTVSIAKGTYRGLGNVNIDTHGKAIKIEGAGYLGTIIDCQWSARGFIFQNAETSATEIRSLTVQK